MKIEEINLVTKECDAQDINVVEKPNKVFFDTHETLSF